MAKDVTRYAEAEPTPHHRQHAKWLRDVVGVDIKAFPSVTAAFLAGVSLAHLTRVDFANSDEWTEYREAHGIAKRGPKKAQEVEEELEEEELEEAEEEEEDETDEFEDEDDELDDEDEDDDGDEFDEEDEDEEVAPAPRKRTAAKKVPAKKAAPAKRAPAKKAAPAKRTAAKKTTAVKKSAPAKKVVGRKRTTSDDDILF